MCQLNGFGGRGPGGQNAPSRIIKHTAVGWDGVGSQIDMGWCVVAPLGLVKTSFEDLAAADDSRILTWMQRGAEKEAQGWGGEERR